MHSVRKKHVVSLTLLFLAIGWLRVTGFLVQRNHQFGQSSIFTLCSFTPSAIYPSLPLAKGPCLLVALIICTNFLCNLFPSQPPTWSSSVMLLKVEPLIPASPLPPITSYLFPLPKSDMFFLFEVSIQHWSNVTFASSFSVVCYPSAAIVYL